MDEPEVALDSEPDCAHCVAVLKRSVALPGMTFAHAVLVFGDREVAPAMLAHLGWECLDYLACHSLI